MTKARREETLETIIFAKSGVDETPWIANCNLNRRIRFEKRCTVPIVERR